MTSSSHPLHPHDFPVAGSSAEKLRFLLGYAILAPSSHNSQPWLFEIEDDEVTLRADRTRAMPALDPNGRELIISCGAALGHLGLAMRAFGYAALVQVLPDSAQPDLLARVRLSAQRPPTDDDELLFRFVTQRHTHRGEYAETALPPELLHALEEEAAQEDATLMWVQSEKGRRAVIELIEGGDVAQNRDAAVRRDVAHWIAPAKTALTRARNDGIPTQAMGIGAIAGHLMPLAQRVFNFGQIIADKDAALAHNAPGLAVICTAEDNPREWLSAGQALSRVLLRARAAGVYASFFSQPIQVDEAWFHLRHVLGVRNFPQLVFRLGYALPVAATPRRGVAEVATEIPTSNDLN